MTQTPDITPEAVERIATDLMGFDAAYKMPTCSTAAHTLAALSVRLAEVEAERDEAVEGCGNFWTALARAEAAEARIEELEAKLAKAVEASVEAVWAEYTDSIESKWMFQKEHVQNAMLRTLAELKGEKDE
jgi:predicted extracellular nuclease